MRSSLLIPAACLIVALSASLSQSQEKNREDISFETFDGVLIKGWFYPSATKGGNAPVVMLLHKFGSDRSKQGWDELATHLQGEGYAVLSFDFRGHGGSTNVKPEKFWLYGPNRAVKHKDVKQRTISFKDFNSTYLPYLINDLVAARWDLDNRNDNGQCNTSNIIVIGAEEGASLGLAWMALENVRPANYKQNNFLFGPANPNLQPGSDDLAGAIWLTFSKSPQRNAFPYSHFVRMAPGLRDNIPMWFAVGQNDKVGLSDTNHMYDNILRADRKKDQLELTFKKPIAGTDLRGAAMLGAGTTNADIDKYLKKLVERRPNTSQKKRNASDSQPMVVPLGQMGFQG